MYLYLLHDKEYTKLVLFLKKIKGGGFKWAQTRILVDTAITIT